MKKKETEHVAKNIGTVFNKRINFKSNKSIDQVDTFYDLVFSQKLSKDNSIRPEKDSHTGPSKTSSFSRNELKANSKKFVGLESTSSKIKSHMRRAKNKSIHFIKSNYSEGSGIMTPKLNLSQKKITAQIYEKSKKIKTHDRSKTGLSHVDKSIFEKVNARSSRGNRELGSFKHVSPFEKEPRSLRTSEQKPVREKPEDSENVFKGSDPFEESVPVPIEELEEFPIEKKELSLGNSDKKPKQKKGFFEAEEEKGSSGKKKIVFSEINNRVQESGVKKLSMVNNSALTNSETKKPAEIKKLLKKLNRLQSPQFELRKNSIPGLLHMSKYFKTEPFTKPEKSSGQKKWFTEEHKSGAKNRSSFLRKIFQEKSAKSRPPKKSPFDSWTNKSRKPKNKSFCRENQAIVKTNLFKSQIMLGVDKLSAKSGESARVGQAKPANGSSIAYTRKVPRDQPNYQIHLDSFRKISKDSPQRKKPPGKTNAKKNVFKWQSGSKDSFNFEEHNFVSHQKDFISKNTITPEFIKPSKVQHALRKASNQVLFSPEFKAESNESDLGLKGLSLNVSRRKSRKANKKSKAQGSKVNIKAFLVHNKKRLKSAKREKTEGKRGNQSLMLNPKISEVIDSERLVEALKSKKSKSLLKTLNKAKSRTPRQFEPPKNKSMVIEGNWKQLGKTAEQNQNLKKKYRTNENIKSSSKKKSKCKSMLPHTKLKTGNAIYDNKVASFFQLQSEEADDKLELLKYEPSCKSESFNDMPNIETDIQIKDFVNVYTEEVSRETASAPRRNSQNSGNNEAQERVTKNKFKSRKGGIQVPKELLQQLKSQEDNFSSQTVTSNKKKKRLIKVAFKGGTVKEGIKGISFSKRKRPHGGPQVKKLRIEARYKSNQNPSKVDFSKYGSAKGNTEKGAKQVKAKTQKLNLKKFMGKKSFNRKGSENNSQKRTSSVMISSDGFNISRKYGAKADLSMNQSCQKPKLEESAQVEQEFSIENNLASFSENEAGIKKLKMKMKKSKMDAHSSFDKKVEHKPQRKPKKSSAHLRKKHKTSQLKQLKKITMQRLPASLLDPSKIAFLGKKKRPPKMQKNRPPRLPKKSKTTKNKFYETDNPFEKKKYFKSKVHGTDKRDTPNQRRITELAQVDVEKRGYTSGGFVQVTPSNTSKNFSKRSNLKFEMGKVKSSKVNLKSRESNLFSNEHNFIGHNSKGGNHRRGSKNFNSHQVSKKNNKDPAELDKETSLTSSNFQKKYVLNNENTGGIRKSKNANKKTENLFKKQSLLKPEKYYKIDRKPTRARDEVKKSKKNHFVKLPQNLSEISNSKISNSRMKDNFSKYPSKKANRAFKQPKSVKNAPAFSKKKVSRGQFQSNPSKVDLNKMISPTLTSIDLERGDSVGEQQKYKLEDTNNIYVDNYMRNMRDCKTRGKSRKNSAQTLSQISLNPKQMALTNYLNDNLQGFSNIYNLNNRKKKSQISNEVNSSKNLGFKKDYSSQSSFYNVSKNLSESRSRVNADNRKMLANQTSLLEKDFRRKTDMGSFQRVLDAKALLPQSHKTGLSKKPKKLYPINQSNSFYYSKKNLKHASLVQESPTQSSWNYSNNSVNFSKGHVVGMAKKKPLRKKS